MYPLVKSPYSCDVSIHTNTNEFTVVGLRMVQHVVCVHNTRLFVCMYMYNS